MVFEASQQGLYSKLSRRPSIIDYFIGPMQETYFQQKSSQLRKYHAQNENNVHLLVCMIDSNKLRLVETGTARRASVQQRKPCPTEVSLSNPSLSNSTRTDLISHKSPRNRPTIVRLVKGDVTRIIHGLKTRIILGLSIINAIHWQRLLFIWSVSACV